MNIRTLYAYSLHTNSHQITLCANPSIPREDNFVPIFVVCALRRELGSVFYSLLLSSSSLSLRQAAKPREILNRRNTVGALLTLNMELNKKSPPGNGDSKGGFRATQRC